MREALRGLTARGRAFLAGGATAAVCGIVLGEKDLVMIGLLGALLPLVGAAWMARPGYQLRVHRSPSGRQTEVGQRSRVRLELTNNGSKARRLRLEENIPFALGGRPRFAVDEVAAGKTVELDYPIEPELRGGYLLGPLSLRAGDPFGLIELQRSFSATNLLVVTPHIQQLPPINLRGAWSGAGENRPRSFASGNAADVTVREYRRGDDLRRVHWRSSARTGDLMVRREEQPWQSRCTLLIDNRARAHTGRGLGSSLEVAVETAASVAVHLIRRGYQVRLVTATGEELGAGWHDGSSELNAGPLLEELALLGTSEAERLITTWVDDSVSGAMFLAVLGNADEGDQPFFSRVQRAGGAAYALVVETSTPGATDGLIDRLRTIGWQTSRISAATPLVAAWQELAR